MNWFMKINFNSKHLSLFRILFYSTFPLFFFPITHIAKFQNIPPVMLLPIDPNPVFQFVINNPFVLSTLVILFYLGTILSILGIGSFWPRLSVAISTWLLTGLFSVCGIYHYRFGTTILVLFILVFFDLNRHFSILKKKNEVAIEPANFEFRIIQFAYFWLFFDAAIAKWLMPNWGWFDETQIRLRLEYTMVNFSKERFWEFQNQFNFWLLERPKFLMALTVSTIVVESIAMLGFFVRKLMYPMVILSALFLCGISVFLGVNFIRGIIPILMIFLPYAWIMSKLRDDGRA